MRSARFFLGILGIFGLSLVPRLGSAADFESPRTAALGGAGRASPLLNDAIYLNPSFISFLPTSSVAANYSRLKQEGRNSNFSILDGRSELFQAGVGYTLQEDRRMVHFGGSRAIFERYGVGLGGKMLIPHGTGVQALWEYTLAMTALPWNNFQAALTIENVRESARARELGFYRSVQMGTKYNFEGLVLAYFDPHWTPHARNPYGYGAGLEFPFFSDFFLRMGTFRNSRLTWLNDSANGYASGVGWVAPKLSLDVAVQRVQSPVTTQVLLGGATIYF